MKFTFEPTKKVSTDNEVGVLYKMYKKTKFRNPKFKPEFAVKIKNRSCNFGSASMALINIYTKTKSLKCECCNSGQAYFKFKFIDNRVILSPFVQTIYGEKALTVDHNVLKSLGGSNSIDNYTPLCDFCNTLRGSRFADYDSFKYWYDNTPPNHRTSMPAPNFCFIDFKRNLNDGHHLRTIAGTKVLPESATRPIIKRFRKGETDLFQEINFGSWEKMDRDFVNDFISSLIHYRFMDYHNIQDYQKEKIDFFNFPKGMNDGRQKKKHITARINNAISRGHKLHRQRVNALTPVHKEQPVQKAKFAFKDIFTYIRNIFA